MSRLTQALHWLLTLKGPIAALALALATPAVLSSTGPANPIAPYKIVEPEIIDKYKHLYKEYVSGDEYEPSAGSVTFQVTDVEIAGNFDLPVKLTRWIPRDDLKTPGGLGSWRWNVPMIRGFYMENVPGASSFGSPQVSFSPGGWRDGKNCSGTITSEINVYFSSLAGAANHNVSPHIYWDGKLLHIPERTSEKFLTDMQGKQITKSNHYVESCITLSSGQEGFWVRGPDGTRYRFDRIYSYDSGKMSYNGMTPLRNFTRLILATRVEDRFGNFVNYSYDENFNLKQIKASDGRQIDIEYESYPGRSKTPEILYRPKWVEANGRRWHYQYTNIYSPSDGAYAGVSLSKVTLPDDSFWEYSPNFREVEFFHSGIDLMIANENRGGTCGINSSAKQVSLNVKKPSGSSTSYLFKPTYFGRSKVDAEPQEVTYCDATFGCLHVHYSTIARNLNCSVNLALSQKTVTAPSAPSQVWSYEYSSNAGTYYPEYAGHYSASTLGLRPPFGITSTHGNPSNISDATDFRTTTVTGPDKKTIFYIDRKFHSPTEGAVVAEDHLDLTGALLKRTEHTSSMGTRVGKHWWQGSFGIAAPTERSLNSNLIEFRVNKIKTVTKLVHNNGTDTYTTAFQDYDDLGFAGKTVESNSFSNRTRHTKQGYLHDRTRWILGLPTTTQISSTDSGYTTVSEITYHDTANTGKYTGWYVPYEFRSYGTWIRRYPEYHTSGTQASALGQLRKLELNQKLTTSSGATSGKHRYQLLTDYKRGKPQRVEVSNRYNDTDAMAFSRTINDDGWTTSITDLNGITAFYGYDSVGRLTSLDLPEPWLDTFVEWYDDTINGSQRTATRCKLNSYRTDCLAGTETLESIADFDGFYRVTTTTDRDITSNIERHRNFAYDSNHNLVFESYPSDYPGELGGVTRRFDALDREILHTVTGGGTTSTHYLAGNKKQVNNGRGFYTTTSFLAYGSPDYSQPLEIRSPENVTTTHAINIFGDLTSITQSGPGKDGIATVSQTDYRAYDSLHKLCKVVRVDVGTTVMSNNVLGEVQWQAAGVSAGTNTSCTSNVIDAQKVTLKYDNLGDLHQMLYSSSEPDAAPNIIYTRDRNGNVTTLQAGSVTQTYNYNVLGLLEDERLQVDSKNYWVDYNYDGAGNLKSLQYPNGDLVSFAPNAFGEPTQATRQARTGRTAFTYASSAKYYANGMMNTFAYGNGLTHKSLLNERQIPRALSDGRSDFTALHYEYEYDNNLNITALYDRVNSSYSLTNFSYDGLDRLKATTGNNGMGNSSLKYDGLGNITYYASKNSVLDYTYNTSLNRLTSVAGSGSAGKNYTFAYDARGNVTGNGSRSFNYNLANQMTGSSGYSYLYDGHNRRVKQTDSKGTSYSFYSQSGQLLYREIPAGGVNYIHLGKKLIAKDGVSPENNARQHYRPFGSSIEGESDDVGYTGHKFDKDLGLSYMQARYYDPVIGRFYSNDPVGYLEHLKRSNPIHGFGRYSYANNNPYLYNDPDGEWAHIAVAFVGGAVASVMYQGIVNGEVNWGEVAGTAVAGAALAATLGGSAVLAGMTATEVGVFSVAAGLGTGTAAIVGNDLGADGQLGGDGGPCHCGDKPSSPSVQNSIPPSTTIENTASIPNASSGDTPSPPVKTCAMEPSGC